MAAGAEGFDRVYRTYGRSLYRFCLTQLGNAQDAEDALQEVFLKWLLEAPEFRSEEHERRWLYRVTLNRCRDMMRLKHRTEVTLELAEDIPMSPEDRTLLGEVAALPEKLRTTIHLYYYEGYSVKEITKILCVSASAVKLRLKCGRDALRTRLEEEI